MGCYWILITLSWIGAASPQYINTAGTGAETLTDPLDFTLQFPPLPYVNYLNTPQTRNDYETFQNREPLDQRQFNQRDTLHGGRKRRTVEEIDDFVDKRWQPNLIDKDKTIYIGSNERASPFIVGLAPEDNSTHQLVSTKPIDEVDKRSFSPWGGKRGNIVEQMWTWKRSSGIKEPNMPKRVRFSPWGGKRSGQMVYKPGAKASKILFSASVPELTKIVSNYSPNEDKLHVAGLQLIPTLDKRHPLKVLALSTQMNGRTFRDSLPFNKFMETLPKTFKPGHPYLDVNLNKEGKRKVKFSAWGGKRSPPIIGPIWTPASQDIKDSTLDTIVLIRNNQNYDDLSTM